MFAVAVIKPGKLQIVDVPEPTPGPYEARIRTEVACLCNATDRKLIEGHFPGVENYPLLLGHETVGIVDAVGEKVRGFKVGGRVVGRVSHPEHRRSLCAVEDWRNHQNPVSVLSAVTASRCWPSSPWGVGPVLPEG